ncbi:MAG: hypothetical protein ACFFF4_04175 [Candidatus Thorarchaeota archaeon]
MVRERTIMRLYQTLGFTLIAIILVCMPSSTPSNTQTNSTATIPTSDSEPYFTDSPFINSEIKTGVLDPITIEHTASSIPSPTKTLRTDTNSQPDYNVYLPSGVAGNSYSAYCDGGYFQVGTGGSADFSSPAGTISWWGKWVGTPAHGRFWGQDQDFETRWSAGSIVLDFGGDNTLIGSKSDWVVDHWYFFAITWDMNTDFLAFYWGDENTTPVEDASDSSWTNSLTGLHLENRIMNSKQINDPVNGYIDDFRYFTIQRSLEDLQGDYETVLSGNEPGLSHYYKFENDLSDSAGNIDLVPVGSFSHTRDVYKDINGWRGRQIDLSISNLQTLYALNGTFDNGIPGTNLDWLGDGTYHPYGWLARREVDDFRGRQRTSYIEDVDDYIVLENEGYFFSSPDRYAHFNGTKIYWYQNIENPDLNEEFLFNLNYLYQRGPIGSKFAGNFTLRFDLFDGSNSIWNWSRDLTNISLRQQWYSPGPMLVNLSAPLSSFEARVSLEVTTPGTSVEILDNDPTLDGDAANAQFITVLLDDLSLTSVNLTDPVDVSLTVSEPNITPVPIEGASGSGSVLLNYSYWSDSTINIQFSANANVSFVCSARFGELYRVLNSSYITSLDSVGVAYSCSPGEDLNLTMYTYIPAYPEVQHKGFNVYHPSDWGNTTILDPFGVNVTNSVLSQETIDSIPIGVVDSEGWWIIRYNSPNYVEQMLTERLNDSMLWVNESVFADGEQIRCNVLLGTEQDTPTSNSSLELKWIQPSDVIWYMESNSSFTGYKFTSSPLSFSPQNASPGLWKVEFLWENGTEVACQVFEFELHHLIGIIAYTPSVDTQVNDSFVITVYLYDQDTGTPILSGDADVIANWSGAEIELNPNLAQSWWEVELNSTSVAVGQYNIVVNATMPYYETAGCIIDVHVNTITIMTIYSGQQISISPGDNYTAKVRYMYIDGSGIDHANVSILTWNGPAGGLEYSSAAAVPDEIGNYTFTFKATISGTYYITIISAKEEHSPAATSFYLIVEPAPTVVEVDDTQIPDVMYFNQTYTLLLYYHTIDGEGIEGATLNVTSNPIAVVEKSEVGDGYYEVSVRVPDIGSFGVYLRFEKPGFQYSYFSIPLDIHEIPTSLSTSGFDDTFYQGQNYELAIFYNSSIENGVEGAELAISPSIRNFISSNVTGNGWYNLTITPVSGRWDANIWLMRGGFVEQTYSFTLDVVTIPFIIGPEYPLNQTYSRTEDTIMTLTFTLISTATGEEVTGALLQYFIETPNQALNNIVQSGAFRETMGIYSANISIPKAGLYVLRLVISKENYETLVQDCVLNSIVDPNSLYYATIGAGIIGALAIFIIIVTIQVSRKFYTKIMTERSLELLELKTRLEESKNLIGFLVIHRVTGLPVYSKILKGGFEDTLLSSFISAISHFRSEFAMDEPMWTVIPITEMIAVVQTESFVCALISLEIATVGQKQKLEEISREIGVLFDHDEELKETIVRGFDPSNSFMETITPAFNELFEIPLRTTYVGIKKDIPIKLQPVGNAISALEKGHGVTPEAIIKLLTKTGYNERQSYLMVFACLDNDYLIQGPAPLPALGDIEKSSDFTLI